RAEVIRACREYFDGQGFLPFDAPILTPAACEGTTNLFAVPYFDETAYLTQSGQLYGEAGAMAFGKVYVFGPTFRAEKSKTRRHLTEFWMIEPEMAFAGLDEDMDLAEDFLVHVVRRVRERRAAELRALRRRAGSRRVRRDHRGRPARGRRGGAGGEDPLPRARARRLRLVSRSPPLRLRPARRLRHGHRALRRLAVRPASRARDRPL